MPRKKKVETVKIEEEAEKELLTFREFYVLEKNKIDYAKPCHPDWYMLGASKSQYPLSDDELTSPLQSYETYKKENS